ncbi:site-2 protease family protein [Fictibacillus sp. Mic-4]|uniref:site-2 protease family protein n=1 Tax=Fictibacillus TaxID=1329200 RepID=UPI00042691B3|nr:site-2 protease family protein [Fictibacillus gelatini]
MEQFLAFSLQELPYVIIAFVIGFTVHEYAHALVAYKCGDPTAKNLGRLTLSPVSHIDPIGTILILIAGFGWARPVPVDRRNFKRPHLHSILVSIAGPLSNLIVAFIGIIVFYALFHTGILQNVSLDKLQMINDLITNIIKLNVLLFVFNLFPLPPLDGYRVLEELAPDTIRQAMMRFEHFGILLFFIIIITPLNQYFFNVLQNAITVVISSLTSIVYPFFS